MFRFLTAGESHGPSLTGIIEGLPAGLPISEDYIAGDLARRQGGYGRGARQQIERDRAAILAGVRLGRTTGSPITLSLVNRDYQNWVGRMAAGPTTPEEEERARISMPRPGHADLGGRLKYGLADMRDVLERASARETAIRVALGAVARRYLEEFGIRIIGHIPQIGTLKAAPPEYDPDWIAARAEGSPFRTTDPAAEEAMKQLVDQARAGGDTVGGLYEVVAFGVPPGLGSYSQWDRRLDGVLAQSFMSINATKAVEIGTGFGAAALPGSEVHDELYIDDERGLYRKTNRAGGIEGGMTTGDPVVVRGAMKPLSTLMRPLNSVDLRTRQPAIAHAERSDVCAVPAAAVVGEAVMALALAGAMVEKFGGDHIDETRDNLHSYLLRIERHTGWVHGDRQVYCGPGAGSPAGA